MCTVIHPVLVFAAAHTVLDGFLFSHNAGLLTLRITNLGEIILSDILQT